MFISFIFRQFPLILYCIIISKSVIHVLLNKYKSHISKTDRLEGISGPKLRRVSTEDEESSEDEDLTPEEMGKLQL